MKKFNFIAAALMATCCAFTFVSCDKGDDTPEEEEGLHGYVTEDLTLEEGQTYYLSGSLQVQAPATLTIEPGVTVIARNNGQINYILIEQGAKINAQGTAENPIVLTAENQKHGAWGGLHICGRAHTNVSGGHGVSEIGNAPYGGDDNTDNSGVIKYVRLEYTGYSLDEDHEANGLSLYGVGNGTQISYVQAYKGSDDGIEFFGGSVNIDHCVVVDCTDDSFDWTEGWNGTAQNIVAYQISSECDCLMECDNNGDNFAATPFSRPTVKYATFVGNNSDDNTRGLRFRAGTEVELSYALVTGKAKCITLETEQTDDSFTRDTDPSTITYTYISSDIESKWTEGEEPDDVEVTGEYASDDFTATGNNNTINYSFKNEFTGNFLGTVGESGAVSSSSDWTKDRVRAN